MVGSSASKPMRTLFSSSSSHPNKARAWPNVRTLLDKHFNNNVHLDKGFEFFEGEFTPQAYMFVHIDFSCSIQVRKMANLE